MTEPADNTAHHRYEINADGAVAYLAYARQPTRIFLVHTEVPPTLEGRGFAGSLARHALAIARDSGLRVIAECPFLISFLQRHPEYDDLIDTASDDED